MLLDNETKERSAGQWLAEWTKNGKLDIVTGYFSVGGLSFLSEMVNDRVKLYRFILGDMVQHEGERDRALDLLNDNITLEAAFKLSADARRASAFLEQSKVDIKTLEPNFCHAKAYIFDCETGRQPEHYFITGSSNLTEAGLGLKPTCNVELNTVAQGTSSDYAELKAWFEQLWNRPQAHAYKTVDGKKVDFKEYLLAEIATLFKKYTPRDVYYKVLFELFGDQIIADINNPDLNRQMGRLENTVVYNSLFEFQQKGVLSLIKMLQKYNGAILADAVGLGKTWSALAVMKFFQMEGHEIILLCPKKLEQNWRKYLVKQASRFEDDHFNYTIRFHTDLQDTRLQNHQDGLKIREYFQSDRPKLLVIDESHNLRNDKSERYKFLVEQFLKPNASVKVLMLSATPINNTLQDIRNQFKLMVKNDPNGFDETLGIKNIDYIFRKATQGFKEWRQEDHRTISSFIKKLPDNFFRLTDALTVARTRRMIAGQAANLTFPDKAKPDNVFVTPKQMGSFETFEELFKHFPPKLSGYSPSLYLPLEGEVKAIEDEQQRDFFLVKMMYILMVKRLESSWSAFKSTVETILAHHENAFAKVSEYQKNKKDADIDDDQLDMFSEEEEENPLDEFTLGKKRKVRLSDIDKAGKLEMFKKDLKADIESLDTLKSNLERFAREIEKETTRKNNLKSRDDKLQVLIEKIRQKRLSGKNNDNQKVLVFTVYRDTAKYLYDQLKARGFDRVGFISGSDWHTSDHKHEAHQFEGILERFAPYTKLFREKEWKGFKNSDDLTPLEQFNEWKMWVEKHHKHVKEQLEHPIDILIATDCLSEGQNLQDCDFVANYDIHWNPVRVIQRMGRVDRLGSPNSTIYGVNFWPSDNINEYLDLQTRIEDRMTQMLLAGSEVNKDFTETLKARTDDDKLEQKQKARMLEQMQTTWDDIETSDQGLGFNDLSLEIFRQDLALELQAAKEKYEKMPRAVYTGFEREPEVCQKDGIIALLGYPARISGKREHSYKRHDLMYVDHEGAAVLLNQKEVLDAIAKHKNKERVVPDAVDRGEATALQPFVDALKVWLSRQAGEVETGENGEQKVKMGQSAKDVLNKLKSGDKIAVNKIKSSGTVEEQYQPDNCDLLAWFLVG